MKKLLSTLLAVSMVATLLVGCGNSGAAESTGTDAAAATETEAGSDAAATTELLNVLQGPQVEPRKKYIYENAKDLGFEFD